MAPCPGGGAHACCMQRHAAAAGVRRLAEDGGGPRGPPSPSGVDAGCPAHTPGVGLSRGARRTHAWARNTPLLYTGDDDVCIRYACRLSQERQAPSKAELPRGTIGGEREGNNMGAANAPTSPPLAHTNPARKRCAKPPSGCVPGYWSRSQMQCMQVHEQGVGVLCRWLLRGRVVHACRAWGGGGGVALDTHSCRLCSCRQLRWQHEPAVQISCITRTGAAV